LALGHLQQRNSILTALDNLPQAPLVFAEEVNFSSRAINYLA
jgi:hypothetical protein